MGGILCREARSRFPPPSPNNMKTLKFMPHLVDLVLSGEKTTTWRLFDDKDLTAGDIVTLIKRPELVPFAEAEIINVSEKPLKDIAEADLEGHEKYDSQQKMYENYSRYYNRPVDGNTLVKVVRFKILKTL